MKRLKRLKRVSKDRLPKALSGAFHDGLKSLDVRINRELEAVNRSQLRAGEVSRKQSDIYQQAVDELEQRLSDSGVEAATLRKEISNLRADVSQTTARLLDYIAAKNTVEEAGEDDPRFSSLFAIIESLKEEMERIEESVAARVQRFLTGPIGRGGGGAIRIENDGELITEQAKCLNFIGEDVLVVPDPDNPDCLAIYIPPPPFALQFINCNPGLIEIGIVVDTVNLTWDWTVPEVINQLLTGPGTYPPVTDASRSAAPTDLMNDRTNQTWCIAAEDPLTGLTDSGCCPLIFGAFQYWGRLPTVPTTSAEVRSLSSSRLVSGKNSTIDFGTNPTPQFTLFCYPDDYGDLGDVINPANNFAIPTIREANVNVTNDQGITLVYRVYRANQLQAGSITWQFASNSNIQLNPV